MGRAEDVNQNLLERTLSKAIYLQHVRKHGFIALPLHRNWGKNKSITPCFFLILSYHNFRVNLFHKTTSCLHEPQRLFEDAKHPHNMSQLRLLRVLGLLTRIWIIQEVFLSSQATVLMYPQQFALGVGLAHLPLIFKLGLPRPKASTTKNCQFYSSFALMTIFHLTEMRVEPKDRRLVELLGLASGLDQTLTLGTRSL